MPVRITGAKNLTLHKFDAENSIDRKASQVRSRFATEGKHQLYADKRDEANRFLIVVDTGEEPIDEEFPYLVAETGISAATMIDLAHLWIFMNNAWKSVASVIEQITTEAKQRVRGATGPPEIQAIVDQTTAVLDAIGQKPPARPKQQFVPTIPRPPA